jgi:hypothetical protein
VPHQLLFFFNKLYTALCNKAAPPTVFLPNNKQMNTITKTIGMGMGILLLATAACKKNKDCNLVPAKMIRSDCDRVVFQVLSNKVTGDANWTNVQNGKTYTNVVADFNTCFYSAFLNKVTDSIIYINPATVEYVRTNPPPACLQCLAISQAPPATTVRIGEVSSIPCK